MKSIYQTEQDSKAQGFYFATDIQVARYSQRGFVLWSTLEEAQHDGAHVIAAQEGASYFVHKVSLKNPSVSEKVFDSSIDNPHQVM